MQQTSRWQYDLNRATLQRYVHGALYAVWVFLQHYTEIAAKTRRNWFSETLNLLTKINNVGNLDVKIIVRNSSRHFFSNFKSFHYFKMILSLVLRLLCVIKLYYILIPFSVHLRHKHGISSFTIAIKSSSYTSVLPLFPLIWARKFNKVNAYIKKVLDFPWKEI